MTTQAAAPDHGEIIPVILSGGSGTRLWPVSRESFPKQLWPLVSDRTMLQETALRAVGPRRNAGIEDATIVLEPVGRNSAPAITAAALLAPSPDSVLWMMAADAAIERTDALHEALERAVVAAKAGSVVTFGMQPHRAETAYGYIEVGAELAGAPGVHRLARFVEKPDAATAVRLAESGHHLWNSGMFVFTARTVLAEMRRHAPEVLAAVELAVSSRRQDLDPRRVAGTGAGRPRSPPAPTSASTTRWPRRPTMPPSCRPASAGPMWEAGTRYGSGCRRTARATPPSATCCLKAPRTASCAATAC